MQELLDETILLLRKYHIDIERLEEETEHEVTEKIHRNIALLMNDTSVIDYQDTHILYDFILYYNICHPNQLSQYLDYSIFNEFRLIHS